MDVGEFVLAGGAEEDDALLLALRAKAAQAKQRRAGRGGNNKDEEETGAGGEEGAAGPRREVRQPRDIFDVPVEDDYTKPLWIQLNTHDLLSFYQLMHHAVHKECTPVSCPKMSAGPNFEFLWSEGEYSAKPATLSATEYITALVEWARKLTDEFHLDPADEAAFKKTYRLIWSRAFRIAMHLYWHHWQELTALKLDALLNAFTKHFVIFALKFRLLTSWDSVSAIYDLLSSILPPIYATQLRDLRDGKKRTRAGGGPARRAKEARALPVGRRRAYTEWDDRGSEPDSPARAASPPPPPTDVSLTAVAAADLKVEEATKPVLTSVGEVEEKNEDENEGVKKEIGSEAEEREGGDGDTEHVGGREEKGGSTTKSKTSGKKEKRKGSKAKKSGGGSSQHKKGATVAKEEASPLKAGHTLEGIQGSSNTGKSLPDTTTNDRISSGDSGGEGGGGSGRGSRTTSPRLVVDDDRRQKGSRIQMSKEDFVRELQRQKEAKLQPSGSSPLASPRSPKGTVPASLSASPSAERRLSMGDGDDARSRTGALELPEPVRRFFTPPGSPRPEAASPPLSPTATPTSPMSPRSDTGSPSSPAARRLTTMHHAATAPAGLRYPTIPPSFDVAKAMSDLAALDQEYADFEEIHTLEQKLLSARSETAGGGNNALADLFELANGHQAQRGKEKAGSGDDEEEGIYSLLSPRKYAKRPSVINQKEFDELRLQLVEQEKKRSRTWVTKRTSLPRNMQELKGSYIRDPPQAGTLKKDFVTRPS